MSKKNHVGRPSNIELKKRKNKRIILSILPVIALVVLIALVETNSLSKLMGNSVTDYYCIDNSYKLEGDKCVKKIVNNYALLGDVDLDGKVTNKDVDLVSRYIDYAYFDDDDEEASKLTKLQIKVADVNEDGDVYYADLTVLREYLNITPTTLGLYNENVGVKKVCEDGYTLNGNKCEFKEIVPALKRVYSANAVSVTFKPQDNSKTLQLGSTYKIGVLFNVTDNNTYYYVWSSYVNGVNNYNTPCTTVKSEQLNKAFTVEGNTKIRVTIYSDNACKNKLKEVESITYGYSNNVPGSNNPSSKTYKVNYDANGGTGTMKSQDITYGVNAKLNANKFVRSNYYFIGWRAYNNSSGKWMCYTNANKTASDYTNTDNCNKNGYVIYKDSQNILNIALQSQTVTMKALWQYSYNGDKVSFKGFEKDINGATVWPMVKINFYKNANGTGKIGIIPQGTALKAIDMTNKTNENKSYVKVKYNGVEGYINGWLTLVNLPDIIPSALYNITNANSSIFVSRGNRLSGVTGVDIYGSGWSSNMAPIRIETAKKIQKASSLALSHGNRIKIYDSFRPWTVQRKIATAVNANWFTGKAYYVTSDFNKDRNRNTNGASATYIADSKGWFIAIASTNPTSHNLAKAIDVTIAFSDDNSEIPTQSNMHELSGDSVPTKSGVDNNKGELALHNLFMDAGFYFLPSEWWHFEDEDNAYYGNYSSEIKCLGAPVNSYGCGVNQLKLAE